MASIDSKTLNFVIADVLSIFGRLKEMSKSCITASWFEGTWSLMMSMESYSDLFVEDFLRESLQKCWYIHVVTE